MEQLFRRHNRFFISLIFLHIIIMSFFSLFSFAHTKAKVANALTNSGYIIMDAKTFKVLDGENYDARLPMASTTKIMTALIVIENSNLEEKIRIDDRAVGVEGSSVYLKQGEILSIMDLLYCMMLRSGNDSATALALHLAKDVKSFAEMMNIRAKSMGLTNTNFTNPHGLHDDNHYTSCYDLCLISCIAMHNPVFQQIVNTKNITIGYGNSKRYLINKNKFLNLYEGGNGIKTGYTKKSGRCLVSSAERNGKKLVAVVLNNYDTYNVSMQLMDKAFNNL